MSDPISAPPARKAEEEWIDELLPVELDWAELVRQYPIPAITVAALGGFLIGRLHGARIVESVSAVASERLNETIERYTENLSGR